MRAAGPFNWVTNVAMGPDGSLYLLEWGANFGGGNNDSGLYRIDYVKGGRAPVAVATGTRTVYLAGQVARTAEGTPVTEEADPAPPRRDPRATRQPQLDAQGAGGPQSLGTSQVAYATGPGPPVGIPAPAAPAVCRCCWT